MKFNIGEVVQITNTSKSKHKGAIGIVIGYCDGRYKDICRVKLWKNKVINIFDSNIVIYSI